MSKKSNNPLDHVRVKQRGSSWAYYFEKAKVDGKRRRGEGGGYATEQDALMAGVEAYNDYIGGGAKKNDASISFADYLDTWYERTRLYARNNTLELRKKNIRLHIKPALGEYRLSSLSPAIIDRFVQQKRKDGYAYETVARILSNISTALDYAIYPMELLRENPARLIKVPGKEFAPLSHRQPRRRIEDSELALIFQRHPFGSTFHMPLVIGLYFGTRIGEALCLSWDNCDMQRMTLSITQQIQRLAMRGKVGLHYVCDLKTESSRRTLSFDAQVILPLLQRWKRQQAKNELYYGEDYFYTTLSRRRIIRDVISERLSPLKRVILLRARASILSAHSRMGNTSSQPHWATSASASASSVCMTSISTVCVTRISPCSANHRQRPMTSWCVPATPTMIRHSAISRTVPRCRRCPYRSSPTR